MRQAESQRKLRHGAVLNAQIAFDGGNVFGHFLLAICFEVTGAEIRGLKMRIFVGLSSEPAFIERRARNDPDATGGAKR